MFFLICFVAVFYSFLVKKLFVVVTVMFLSLSACSIILREMFQVKHLVSLLGIKRCRQNKTKHGMLKRLVKCRVTRKKDCIISRNDLCSTDTSSHLVGSKLKEDINFE